MRGFTAIELLVGMVFLGVLFFLAGEPLRLLIKGRESVTARDDMEAALMFVAQQIQRVGRLSTSCSKVSASTLECNVDFPSRPATDIRFRLSASGLTYEQNDSGAWKILQTYPDVTGFDICNDTDMATPGLCSIEPQKINEQYVLLSGSGLNRLFRYRLTARSKSLAAKDFQVTLQNAFFVRNPTPSGLVYLWGNWTVN